MKRFLLSIIGLIALANPSFAVEKTQVFTSPKHHGVRLDWCLYWGDECGKPAADYFCKKMGFEYARDYPISKGLSVATYVAGDDKECGPGCDGFTAIRCVKNVAVLPGSFDTSATLKTFVEPTYNGKRIDQCANPGGPCGKVAASYFCKTKGFATATGFLFQKLPNKSTIHLLAKKTCTSGNCWGIKSVTCKMGEIVKLDDNN